MREASAVKNNEKINRKPC